MRPVVVVSVDHIGPELAGAGVRALEIARALGRLHPVTLAAPVGSSFAGTGPVPEVYDPDRPRTLRRLLPTDAVVIAAPLAPRLVRASGIGLWIVDLYNPEPFEGLAHERRSLDRRARDLVRIDRIAFAARRGSAFVCASERQRDMWLGFLAANRRLESGRYVRDRDLRALIEVVPFGTPSQAPVARGAPLRGDVFPQDAKIVVWNGGLWDWLDPETVVRAIARLRATDPSWRLVFAGVGRPGHPSPMNTARRAIGTADKLGLRADGGLHVREWTPYVERGSLLLEADVGASAHLPGAEARFAHRTRMLDLVWARVPIVCTAGDEWSDIVRAQGLGEVVEPADPDAFAAALDRVVHAGRAPYEPALAAAAATRRWDLAVAPLDRLLKNAEGFPRCRPRRGVDAVGSALALRHTTAGAAARARAALQAMLRA